MELISCKEGTRRETVHRCKTCAATVSARWILHPVPTRRRKAA
jgi:hypothetical protein